MTLPIHICHFTTVHPRDDVRVFYKQCISLAKEGLKVTLIVADGKGNEFRNGVDIIDIGKSSGGRFTRITKTSKTMFNKLLQIDADIYQFHDPELLSTGGKLKS